MDVVAPGSSVRRSAGRSATWVTRATQGLANGLEDGPREFESAVVSPIPRSVASISSSLSTGYGTGQVREIHAVTGHRATDGTRHARSTGAPSGNNAGQDSPAILVKAGEGGCRLGQLSRAHVGYPGVEVVSSTFAHELGKVA